MAKPERLELQSADGVQLNLDALYQIAPSCFTEAEDPKTSKVKRMVNFDILRQLLGDDSVEDAPEAYEFNWVGKQAARADVLRPINKTLRPVKEDSVDWDNTQNLYIEGDNLEVLKLLQKSYLGKVKMIYIDPPYNTGNDFVYHDDFARTQEQEDFFAGNIDEQGNRYIKNTESNGRFHSDWCSMMYSRLIVARTLLSEDGIIFISIGDTECANTYKLCNEVFGESNFIAKISIVTGANQAGEGVLIQKNVEYCFAYGKNITSTKVNRVDKTEESYRNLNDAPTPLETRPDMGYTLYFNPNTLDIIPQMDYKKEDIHLNDERLIYHDVDELIQKGYVPVRPGKRNGKLHRWRWGFDTFKERKHEIKMFESKTGYTPKFMQSGYNPPKNIQNFTVGTSDLKKLFGEQVPFEYSKGINFMKYLVNIGTNEDSIIIDFFSGSATTAHAVMQLNAEDMYNRKFVMVQLPEETDEDSNAYKVGYKNICEIGKERIRRAGKKIKEENHDAQDLDTGFRVFRVDSSNFEEVEHTPKEWNQDQLDLFLNNIKSDRDDLDLLFGCMLDWGVQLSLPMTSEEVDGKMIYTVNEGDLVACFADKVTDNVVKAMADKMPLRVIFRDSCFSEDSAKINIYETIKQLMDWSDQEVVKNIRVI